MACKALNGRGDVSCRGFRVTLKSPPRIKMPSWNVDNVSVMSWKKVTWWSINVSEGYGLAKVGPLQEEVSTFIVSWRV